MDVKTSAKIDMFTVALDFLELNAAITLAVPTLNTAITSAKGLLEDLGKNTMLQDEDYTGSEIDKNEAKQVLINNSITLSGSLTAYATAVNNNTLLKMIDYTPTELKRATDAKIKEYANILYTQGLPAVAALGPYGVTAASLTSFNTSIAAFKKVSGKPKTNIAIRKQYTTQTKILVKQLDTIFKTKIDKLMLLVRNTNPKIYADYDNLRRPNKPPHQKIAFKIHVTDFDTQTALPGMLFYIDGTTKPLKTTEKGNAQKKHMAFGVQKGHAIKAGYIQQNFSFAITQGQTTKLVIVMKKEPGVIVPTFEKGFTSV